MNWLDAPGFCGCLQFSHTMVVFFGILFGYGWLHLPHHHATNFDLMNVIDILLAHTHAFFFR